MGSFQSTRSVSLDDQGHCLNPSYLRSISGEEFNQDDPDPSMVYLNVYDLNVGVLQANNILNDVLKIGGAFHAAVEIYENEYQYGTEGIHVQAPRTHDTHIYRQTLVMGITLFNEVGIKEKIDEMRPAWQGKDYDIVSRNCCTFARELVRQVVGQFYGKDIPDWIDRFARLAQEHVPEHLIKNVLRTADLRMASTDSVATVEARPVYANDPLPTPFGSSYRTSSLTQSQLGALERCGAG